ncbi:hypothetical protein ESCO_001760 [Escovopsis weberi]|uniref:Replicase polyprotein 1a n=1 Tax=Escovopsis weberi TaxID=150374 RepID=A0A0M8N3T1_ESCWE|nr:hypothetical protein ESCO_001760 [Escovopsis weberi]
MFATLPDFMPRDSHTLWYTSSRNPLSSPGVVDSSHHHHHHHHHHHNNNGGHGHHNADPAGTQQRQRSQHILEKTALARLAADEHYMHLRRVNVQNFGSTWLRPPGVAKTLHQTREEKREQEEHQEAMRREQLAQELAEAEGAMADEGGVMDDIQLDGAQDLDADIPDAGFEEERRDLMAARMRISDDAFREALVRGDPDGTDLYGHEEDLDQGDQGHILDEEDFADGTLDDGLAGDMDANLDDDIPEAEDAGYEHTDSEAEFTSSNSDDDDGRGGRGDEENQNRGSENRRVGGGDHDHDHDHNHDHDIPDVSFAPRAAPLGPPQSPTLRSRLSLPRYRASLDLSGLLSQDESSFMESSPAQGRRARRR